MITIKEKNPKDAMTIYEIEKKIWEEKIHRLHYTNNEQVGNWIHKWLDKSRRVEESVLLLKGCLRKLKPGKFKERVKKFIKDNETKS